MAGTAATNRKTENITSSPRVFCSYIIFARVLRRRGGTACPTGRGRSLPCPRAPSAQRADNDPTANPQRSEARGETLKPRMPLGEVPITPEQMSAPKGLGHGGRRQAIPAHRRHAAKRMRGCRRTRRADAPRQVGLLRLAD